MGWLWSIIIGGIIGWIGGMLAGKDIPGGVIGNIIAGIIGGWLGSLLLGNWGPVIGGYAIVPAIIGAFILVLIVSFVLRSMR